MWTGLGSVIVYNFFVSSCVSDDSDNKDAKRELGDNVVDFVFKTFVSIITFLGYVGNKPC